MKFFNFLKPEKPRRARRFRAWIFHFLPREKRGALIDLGEEVSDLEQFKRDLREIKSYVLRRRKTRDGLKKALEIKYLDDVIHSVNLFLIPSEHNDHKPYAVRPKMLWKYLLLVIGIKLFVTGTLFLTYPTPAELANIVTGKVVQLANQEREALGVSPLATSPDLTKAALAKAHDMIERNYFAHDSPEGRKPWTWIDKSTYDYVYAGENLAVDFTSAELIHQAFMKSPTHRKNILNDNFQDMGVAVVTGELAGRQTDLLVQFFGTTRSDALARADTILALAEPPPEVLPDAEPINQVVTDTGEVAGEALAESPETVLESDAPLNYSPQEASQGVLVVATNGTGSRSLIQLLIEYSNIFFLAMIIFLFGASMINIFVKIRFQHPRMVMQSLAALALILSVFLVKFHFIEQISPQLLIL